MSRDPIQKLPVLYAELHCITNFTFLRGASHPQELVEQACALGYTALAITDECSVAGVVRAHMAAKGKPVKLIIGAEFRLECGLRFVALAIDRRGYGRLCRLITRGRRSASKGNYSLTRTDLEECGLEQCFILWLPASQPQAEEGFWLAERFPRVRIAVELFCEGTDRERLATLERIGREARARGLNLRLVASGDVHMHARARRRLQDTLTAIRLGVPVALRSSIRPSRSRRRARLRRSAASRSMSCDMNIPTSWCRPGRRRPVTYANSRKTARAGAGRAACPRGNVLPSRKSWL